MKLEVESRNSCADLFLHIVRIYYAHAHINTQTHTHIYKQYNTYVRLLVPYSLRFIIFLFGVVVVNF